MTCCHLCVAPVPEHPDDCRVWLDLERFRRVYDRLGVRQADRLGQRLWFYLALHGAVHLPLPAGTART